VRGVVAVAAVAVAGMLLAASPAAAQSEPPPVFVLPTPSPASPPVAVDEPGAPDTDRGRGRTGRVGQPPDERRHGIDERLGGVRCEGAGNIRPDKNRKVRKVVRYAIEFARNPESKQDNSEGVTAGKDEGKDSEALLWPARALVDAVDRGLVVTNPEKEAGRGGGTFDVMP
jgi:hypothetical protein